MRGERFLVYLFIHRMTIESFYVSGTLYGNRNVKLRGPGLVSLLNLSQEAEQQRILILAQQAGS